MRRLGVMVVAALAAWSVGADGPPTLNRFERELMAMEGGAPCIIRYAADGGLTQAVFLIRRKDGTGLARLFAARLTGKRTVFLPVSQEDVPADRRIDLAAFPRPPEGDDVDGEPPATPLGQLLHGLRDGLALLPLDEGDAVRLIAARPGWRAVLAGSASRGQAAYAGGTRPVGYVCGPGLMPELVRMFDEEPAPTGSARFVVGERGRAVHQADTGAVRLKLAAKWKGLAAVLPAGPPGESAFPAASLAPRPGGPVAKLLPAGLGPNDHVERLVRAGGPKGPAYDPAVWLIREK